MRALGVAGVEPETVRLWEAVDEGDEAAVRRCVAAGASASAANRMGLTALHRAAAAGAAPIARALAAELGGALDKGDRVGTTALGVAAGRGHTSVVEALLELGADAAPRREDGATALHLACAAGHVGCALAILRERGEDAAGAAVADREGFSPLDHLEQAGLKGADAAQLAELRATLARARAAGAVGDERGGGGGGGAAPSAPSAPPLDAPPASPPRPPPPAATPPDAPPAAPPAALPAIAPPLSPAEGRRYARHLLLPDVGVRGQLRLKASTVLVVGAGGLGSPVLLYLAAAGIGAVTLCDDDVVEESNLQRQVVHSVRTVGQRKVDSAEAALRALNPHVRVTPLRTRLTRANARELVSSAHVVIDCTDALPTRYAVADACAAERRALVYGAVSQFEGHVAVFRYDLVPPAAAPTAAPAADSAPAGERAHAHAVRPAGYRDLYPTRPPSGAVANCAAAGVLGVVPGIIGALQAAEALKLLLNIGTTLDGTLLVYNALDCACLRLPIGARQDMPVGEALWQLGLREEAELEAMAAARRHGTAAAVAACAGGEPADAAVAARLGVRRVSARDAAARLGSGWAPFVLDVRAPAEASISQLVPTHLLCAHDALLAPGALSSVPPLGDILVYCRSGVRSLAACAELARAGVVDGVRLLSLDGGINAWAADIDPTMLQY
ncbi:hypothetical protein KFE25_010742 [Diacronema lutheri]|uniref:Rhodanese domain-containing protein n=1 Tax=Diacronema lutheri TaxID=2081491 RepID=A0A8J5X4V2_DIALT|nr:hypothetical protein KFE25_010742 [Diacronema lutheri]